jgi:hypothetical protein
LEDTSVLKNEVFTRSKRLKVFDTLFFLETEVSTEYFKITWKPNGAEVLEDTSVFKTEVFARSKRLKVFDTSLFLETEVFTEYFKISLKPISIFLKEAMPEVFNKAKK